MSRDNDSTATSSISDLPDGSSRVPLVTIGMPVYNGSRYLEKAVRSLLDQTERDFVLLISDNCSTDETAEICARLREEDPRIEYVGQTSNIGPARNFEHVLRAARSPFFMWAAHDDLHAPTFLATCLQLLSQARDAVACSVGVQLIDEAGGEVLRMLPSTDLSSPDPVKRARAVFKNGQMAIYGLMRREFVPESAELRDIRGSDVAFVFAFALSRPIVTTSEILTTYRLVEGEAKATGPHAQLYDGTRYPVEMYRSMKREVDRSALGWKANARLRLLLAARRFISARQAASYRNRVRMHHARAEHRWGTVALRLPLELVIGPGNVLAFIRRKIAAAVGNPPQG